MAHESTVEHENDLTLWNDTFENDECIHDFQAKTTGDGKLNGETLPGESLKQNETNDNDTKEQRPSSPPINRFDRQRSIGQVLENVSNTVPHLFAETPKGITHHHDTDDDDTDHSSNSESIA